MALTFPLVSVDSAVFRMWGAMDAQEELPLPATYVLRSDGLIHFRHIGRNASDRATDPGLIVVLQQMAGP